MSIREQIYSISTSLLKGDIRNRFNLIFEERVKMFIQNSQNLMTIYRKKEVMTMKFHEIFLETSI